MKRLHRRWHRLIWCLLLPALAAALMLGAWLRPPSPPLNPGLPTALENVADESQPPIAAPIGKTR